MWCGTVDPSSSQTPPEPKSGAGRTFASVCCPATKEEHESSSTTTATIPAMRLGIASSQGGRESDRSQFMMLMICRRRHQPCLQAGERWPTEFDGPADLWSTPFNHILAATRIKICAPRDRCFRHKRGISQLSCKVLILLNPRELISTSPAASGACLFAVGKRQKGGLRRLWAVTDRSGGPHPASLRARSCSTGCGKNSDFGGHQPGLALGRAAKPFISVEPQLALSQVPISFGLAALYGSRGFRDGHGPDFGKPVDLFQNLEGGLLFISVIWYYPPPAASGWCRIWLINQQLRLSV